MKMLYIPAAGISYTALLEENRWRTKKDPEFEIIGDGICNDDRYFDVIVEQAKESETATLVKTTECNRGMQAASLHDVPTIWFRKTQAWGDDNRLPQLLSFSLGNIDAYHKAFRQYTFRAKACRKQFFCNNETNTVRLYGDEETPIIKKKVSTTALFMGVPRSSSRKQAQKPPSIMTLPFLPVNRWQYGFRCRKH